MATDWPNSLDLVEKMFRDVPDDERRRMVCDNAVEFYHLTA